jgi:transposase
MADGVMPKRFHLKRPDLAQAVIAALSDCKDVKAQRRLLAMRLAASGQFTAAQIAEQTGVSRRQFFHWVNALKTGGLERLVEREHGGGKPAQVQGAALTELQAGLRTGRWKRAKEIQQWLQQRHETRLGLKGVYYWLGKLGGVLKVPRKTHAQKGRSQGGRISTAALQQAQELERGWWKTGPSLGGR